MEVLERVMDNSPLFLAGEDVTAQMHMSKEPLFNEKVTHSYYHGVKGLAAYIYDIVVRCLKFLICTFREPLPEWSWKTTKVVKDEVIKLEDDSGNHLKNNIFFNHLLEYATLPLHASQCETSASSLSQDLVQTNLKATREITIRRHFYNSYLAKVEIMDKTGSRNADVVAEFSRDDAEMREIQRGTYVNKYIRSPNSLFITYSDRADYKREVVTHGLKLAGIEIVSQSSGHPDEVLLAFLEETIFHRPNNGCTSVYYNKKSGDLEFRLTIDREKHEQIEAATEAFNLRQKKIKGVDGSYCRAELSKVLTDDRTSIDIILAIKRSDLS